MQVLSPAEFSWRVFSATSTPQQGSYNPQTAYRSPIFNQNSIAPVYRSQSVTVSRPPVSYHSSLPHNNERMDDLMRQVKFLESEVSRMTEELKVRSGTISKGRRAQEQLESEVYNLREEIESLYSILHTRERQIEELEKHLSISQSQLALMKKRYKEAVETATRVIPGKIKHIAAEQRTIGVQAGDISALENRMSKLVVALRDEKLRNRRIKQMLALQDDGDSSVPPLPDLNFFTKRSSPRKNLVSRGTATPAAITKPKPKLSVQSIHNLALLGRTTRLSAPEQFLEIQINSTVKPPPAIDSAAVNSSFPMSEISPINFQRDSFSIYEDPYQQPPTLHLRPETVLMTLNVSKKNASLSTQASSMRPPKMEVPRLNLAAMSQDMSGMSSGRSNASEAAIKRAVEAALEKRKKHSSVNSSTGGYFPKSRIGCV
jgi:myosin heavy subunit